MTQGGFSKLERSTDPKLSTRHKLAEALGGALKIEIEINGEAFDITGDRSRF